MNILDASAAVDLVLRTERGDRVIPRLADGEDALHAPNLLWLEVTSALRKAVRLGRCTPVRAVAALADLSSLGITLHNDVDRVS